MRYRKRMRRSSHHVASAVIVLVVACGKPTEPVQAPVAGSPVVTPVVTPLAGASASAITPTSAEPKVLRQATTIADDAPLVEGLVSFEGMVRPTKGGYDVRGVTFDDAELTRLMRTAEGAAVSRDKVLGARVRVTALLARHEVVPQTGGEVVQTKAGTFFTPNRLDSAVLVKEAEIIEGALGRSKGMFSLAGHLIDASDLSWAIPQSGGKPGVTAGDKVRLYGQSRMYVCPKDAQCLTSGSLPLFDIGRAERL
jgi:hypothetical protein